MGKIYLSITVTVALIFTMVNSASAMAMPSTSSWDYGSFRIDSPRWWGGDGPSLVVTKTTGLSLSKVYARNYKAFGYSTFNPDTGQVLDKQVITFDGNNPTDIGTFEEGTHIGLWLNPRGQTEISTMEPNYCANRTTFYGETADGNPIIGFETGHDWDYNEMLVSVQASQPHAPAGQPLPGVLISSLLGLGVAGFAKFKKRK